MVAVTAAVMAAVMAADTEADITEADIVAAAIMVAGMQAVMVDIADMAAVTATITDIGRSITCHGTAMVTSIAVLGANIATDMAADLTIIMVAKNSQTSGLC